MAGPEAQPEEDGAADAVHGPAAPSGAAAARAHILRNPEFVLGDAELMAALVGAPADADRKIVDLRGVLISRLERRLRRLAEAHREVVDAAWENIAGMDLAHRAVLALLDARSLQGFLRALLVEVPQLLQADVARLCIEASPAGDMGDSAAAMGLASSRGVLRLRVGGVERRISAASGRRVSLRGDTTADVEIFGESAAQLQSEALLRLDLGMSAGPGLLAFGSLDPLRFHCRQEPDLVVFLASVVERLLREWLEGRRTPQGL